MTENKLSKCKVEGYNAVGHTRELMDSDVIMARTGGRIRSIGKNDFSSRDTYLRVAEAPLRSPSRRVRVVTRFDEQATSNSYL